MLIVMPIGSFSRRDFNQLLVDNYRFIEPDFVLRNAIQYIVDFAQCPDTSVDRLEDEIENNYGSIIRKQVSRDLFGKRKRLFSEDERDNVVADEVNKISQHITEISTYLYDKLVPDNIIDFVYNAEYEIMVKSAWVSRSSIRVIMREIG